MSSARVAAGRVLRAHGVGGALRLRLEIDWEQMVDCTELALALDARGAARLSAAQNGERDAGATAAPVTISYQIASARSAGDDLLVQLVGIDSRQVAQALHGAVVEVPRQSLPPLQPGEVWGFELVGMAAVDEAGAPLGVVVAVDGRGPQLVAQLRRADGLSAMVPMVAGLLLQVQRDQGQVVLRLPEGLWGL